MYVVFIDGIVVVYDDLSSDCGVGGVDCIIVFGEGGNVFVVFINLYGIVYVVDGDKLILFDVGSGVNFIDGKLYVLDNVFSVDGIINVVVCIDDEDNNVVGNIMFGNLVDIVFDGVNFYVVEKF